jgi:predicted transcriptional regulator
MLRQLEVSGDEVRRVAAALANETCLKILRVLSTRNVDVSTLAKKLRLTEPTVSVDVQELENLGMIEVSYAKGRRGIRKICRLAKDRICIKLR